jgi:hypothetical protein
VLNGVGVAGHVGEHDGHASLHCFEGGVGSPFEERRQHEDMANAARGRKRNLVKAFLDSALRMAASTSGRRRPLWTSPASAPRSRPPSRTPSPTCSSSSSVPPAPPGTIHSAMVVALFDLVRSASARSHSDHRRTVGRRQRGERPVTLAGGPALRRALPDTRSYSLHHVVLDVRRRRPRRRDTSIGGHKFWGLQLLV